jgi:hypothetical protein
MAEKAFLGMPKRLQGDPKDVLRGRDDEKYEWLYIIIVPNG